MYNAIDIPIYYDTISKLYKIKKYIFFLIWVLFDGYHTQLLYSYYPYHNRIKFVIPTTDPFNKIKHNYLPDP